LPTIGETDDAEPAIGERDAIDLEIAILIGATMDDGVRHLTQRVAGEESISRKIKRTRNAAHGLTVQTELPRSNLPNR
jgi:hypothetical protein